MWRKSLGDGARITYSLPSTDAPPRLARTRGEGVRSSKIHAPFLTANPKCNLRLMRFCKIRASCGSIGTDCSKKIYVYCSIQKLFDEIAQSKKTSLMPTLIRGEGVKINCENPAAKIDDYPAVKIDAFVEKIANVDASRHSSYTDNNPLHH